MYNIHWYIRVQREGWLVAVFFFYCAATFASQGMTKSLHNYHFDFLYNYYYIDQIILHGNIIDINMYMCIMC